MHAAVQYTDMAMLMSESCDNSHSTSLPGSNQVILYSPSPENCLLWELHRTIVALIRDGGCLLQLGKPNCCRCQVSAEP